MSIEASAGATPSAFAVSPHGFDDAQSVLDESAMGVCPAVHVALCLPGDTVIKLPNDGARVKAQKAAFRIAVARRKKNRPWVKGKRDNAVRIVQAAVRQDARIIGREELLLRLLRKVQRPPIHLKDYFRIPRVLN
jgi:hypothetical protein